MYNIIQSCLTHGSTPLLPNFHKTVVTLTTSFSHHPLAPQLKYYINVFKYSNKIYWVGKQQCSDVRRTEVDQPGNTVMARTSHLITVKADFSASFKGWVLQDPSKTGHAILRMQIMNWDTDCVTYLCIRLCVMSTMGWSHASRKWTDLTSCLWCHKGDISPRSHCSTSPRGRHVYFTWKEQTQASVNRK